MKYTTENELLKIVESFERGTISREEWGHAEHLIVALHYLSNHDYEAAYKKMREGIFKLLRAFEVDLSKEMPYHETLTVFWLQTVEDFKNSLSGEAVLEDYGKLVEKYDKNYPLGFYSRELLFSEKARARFVEADIKSSILRNSVEN